MQGHHRVAARGILQRRLVGALLIDALAVPAKGQLALTQHRRGIARDIGSHRQVQGHHRVAARLAGQRGRVRAGRCYILSVPYKRKRRSTDRRILGGRQQRRHRHPQGATHRTWIGRRERVAVALRIGDGCWTPRTGDAFLRRSRQRSRCAATDGNVIKGGYQLLGNSYLQIHCTITIPDIL